MDIRVIGIADHDAGCLKALGGNTLETPVSEKLANLLSQFELFPFHFVKTIAFGFVHGIAELQQGVGGHGSVVGVATILIGFHDL